MRILSIISFLVLITACGNHSCDIAEKSLKSEPAVVKPLNGLIAHSYISLNGEWKIFVDPYENGYYNYRYEPFDAFENPPQGAFFMDAKAESPGDLIEYDFDKAKSLYVPGDWNTQMPELYYYEGTVWYRNKFDYSKKQDHNVYLYFGAINYISEVYLNGKKLGKHIGGFTPFYFDVTNKINNGSNSVVVKVDNKRCRDGVPTLNTDWWNYGGITREVKLIETPKTHITDFSLQLESPETKVVSGYVLLSDSLVDQNVVVSIPELNQMLTVKTDASGKANVSITASNAQLWSSENPKLYKVDVYTSFDTISDLIGFRTISTEGKKLLLNGQEIFLRGICIHEEFPLNGGGRVNTPEKAKQQLLWAKELNCNFVRLAHYPHNESIVRLADKLGVMVWAEVPVYWTINWTNPETFANAQNQFSEIIQRDKNRAAVIIWSLANETPVIPERTEFLSNLAKHVRSLDTTRLLSAAMEKHYSKDDPNVAVVEDPLADIVDIVSFNQYIGWYDGTSDKCERVTWQIPYNKPVFISEFGAGTKQGLHGPKENRWTEEYQEYLYQETLKMIDKIDGLCGFSPWILIDFRSPRRVLPEIQDDFNRKGLISDEGIKKKAFYVLQEYYGKK